MRKIKILITSLGIIAISLFYFYGHEEMDLPIEIDEKVKDYATGNIAGDNKEYLVVLTKGKDREYGKDIVIYSVDEKEEVYRKDFSHLNPWKVLVGDIDGDRWDEISVGVYKESPFHQVMAKRPFIYSFKDGKIVPKWRGSRLSRPFTDYVFYDIDNDKVNEIISIEILEDGTNILNTYKWKGFGFEGFLESESFPKIEKLMIKDGKVSFNVKDGKKKFAASLKLMDDILVIEGVE